MKNTIRTIGLVCLALVLACAGLGAGAAETASDVEQLGTLAGSVYENSYLGMGCDLPGWHYQSQEEILRENNLTIESLPEDVRNMVESTQPFVVMRANSEDYAQTVSIQLTYAKDKIAYYNIIGTRKLLETSAEEMPKYYEQIGLEDLRVEMTEIRIGNETLPALWATCRLEDIVMYEKQTEMIKGDYLVVVTATCFEKDNTDEVFSHFYFLQDGEKDNAADADGTAAVNYYSFPEAGIHFLIPGGWEEKPLSGEREYLKFKMMPKDDQSATSIQFGCRDLWESVPAATRVLWGVSRREDIDAMVNEETIASLAGELNAEDVRMVEHAGIRYGMYTVKSDTVLGELAITGAVTIHNGVYIQFHMYDPNGRYGDTFASVLDSVYFD